MADGISPRARATTEQFGVVRLAKRGESAKDAVITSDDPRLKAISGGIATTTVYGMVKLASSGSTVAGLVVQANDPRLSTSGGLAAHLANVANPHQVTKAQVGLGSAENTSDLNKPISNATAAALNALLLLVSAKLDAAANLSDVANAAAALANLGGINGSSLNADNLSSGTIPDARFPSILPAIDGSQLTNLPSASPGAGAAKAWVTFDMTTTANQAATYGRAGSTVTVHLVGHGHLVGHVVNMSYTSGGATNGQQNVLSVIDADNFTVNNGGSGTIAAGNTCLLLRNTINLSFGVHDVVTIPSSYFFVNLSAPLSSAFFSCFGSADAAGTVAHCFLRPNGVNLVTCTGTVLDPLSNSTNANRVHASFFST